MAQIIILRYTKNKYERSNHVPSPFSPMLDNKVKTRSTLPLLNPVNMKSEEGRKTYQ